jgi:molybdate transport system ATP-binding protein
MLRASLGKRFGDFVLDVQLHVEQGRTLVLVGESGSGKTTVLRLLAGLAQPDSGRIELDRDCYFGASADTVPAWGRDMGFVPQDSALFPHLTARDNVAFGLRASGIPRAERDDRVDRIIAKLGVAAFATRRPHELSGGQQQRIALARALVLEPRMLLLDEPLSALDARSRDRMRDELHGVLKSRQGVTIFVTHSPADAEALGGDIVTLADGHVSHTQSADR